MHHIAEADSVHTALGEMVRVTRPGGLVLVWDHNPRNPYWKHLMARVPQDDGSERLIPVGEVVSGLVDGGGVILMSEPPSIDGHELTDKGYINQRATLDRRSALVERLYMPAPDADVIVIA